MSVALRTPEKRVLLIPDRSRGLKENDFPMSSFLNPPPVVLKTLTCQCTSTPLVVTLRCFLEPFSFIRKSPYYRLSSPFLLLPGENSPSQRAHLLQALHQPLRGANNPDSDDGYGSSNRIRNLHLSFFSSCLQEVQYALSSTAHGVEYLEFSPGSGTLMPIVLIRLFPLLPSFTRVWPFLVSRNFSPEKIHR